VFGRKFSQSNPLPLPPYPLPRRPEGGWTLIELVIVITVLSILTLGVIPLARTSVRRQKEHRLRESLREMREAIKEFRRDTIAAPCCTQPGAPGQPGQPPVAPPPPQPTARTPRRASW